MTFAHKILESIESLKVDQGSLRHSDLGSICMRLSDSIKTSIHWSIGECNFPSADSETFRPEDLQLPYPNITLAINPPYNYRCDKELVICTSIKEWMGDSRCPNFIGKVAVHRISMIRGHTEPFINPVCSILGWDIIKLPDFSGSDIKVSERKILRVINVLNQGMDSCLSHKTKEEADQIMDEMGGVNSGLISTFLTFLHCNNVRSKIHRPPEKLNKSRKKKGKPPIFEHRTLEVRLSKGTYIPLSESLGGRDSPRLHLVRGHFRNRFGKRFWISPHARGRKELGVIHKDYEIS